MKMKRLLVGVFVLLEVLMCCEGCWNQEREALITLNSHFENTISSWINNSSDCCQWDGVECNTTTRRVTKITFDSYFHDGTWQLNYSDFIIFKDLKTLDLSEINIFNCTRSDQGLKYLEVLDLTHTSFDNASSILSCLDGLSSLKSLLLVRDSVPLNIFQTVFMTISPKLLHLEILDISGNYLTNEILPSLRGFTSLKKLYLNGIGLDSDLHIQGLWAMKNLEILNISNNNFNDIDIASALSDLSSLKSLNLAKSGITPRSINNMSKLRSLEILDLSANNLNGSVDISGLLTLTNLKILDFSFNLLVDFFVPKGSKILSTLNILALDGNMINGSNVQESLRAFPSIRNLSLSDNEFKGNILAEGFWGLRNLEYLAFDYSSNLHNEFLKSIGNLTSLKVLSVRGCEINGSLPFGDWWKLKKLEVLDLSNNNFVGKLPSSFVNMTSLRTLILANNHFIGNIGPNLATFTSLEYLDYEGNQFEFPISFTPFSNHSNLKFIHGNGNKVILDSHSSLKTWVPKFQLQVLQLSSMTEANSIPLPNFLHYQHSLTYMDFTSCKLRGEFPNCLLENNTKMEYLFLRNCSFTGHFQLPFRPNLNLLTIDVSNNAISGQMLNNNISSIFPNLDSLNMSENEIHGSIPYELRHLIFLMELDLSNNQLSGTIPSNFFNSCNLLTNLDMSNNNFIGKIPSQVKNCIGLIELSMSNNNFEGSIPSELTELERLTFLDLSQNNLVGCAPSFVNTSATFIHLNNNKLSCLSKKMFNERSPLVTLDLSNNVITDEIHDLIHDIRNSGLNILIMKGNHFTGNIPKQLCDLANLNMLDLSYNKFVGEIPSCLGKMPFENKDPDSSRDIFNAVMGVRTNDRPFPYHRFWKERENFTSKKRLETYTTNILIYMSGIDISHNKFNGSIPSELGNLTRIRALNLSHNCFIGKIPATFSSLVQVESLDLSFNMLSGEIPPRLSELASIEVFSVAHNNLSGATPGRKGQFITFDESSYEGNQFLCGPPLPKSCNSSTLPNGLTKHRDDDDSWVDMYVFLVSFVVAYTSMLLLIAAVLYINPYWRQAWFYYTTLVAMNCYYFFKDYFC